MKQAADLFVLDPPAATLANGGSAQALDEDVITYFCQVARPRKDFGKDHKFTDHSLVLTPHTLQTKGVAPRLRWFAPLGLIQLKPTPSISSQKKG